MRKRTRARNKKAPELAPIPPTVPHVLEPLEPPDIPMPVLFAEDLEASPQLDTTPPPTEPAKE